MIHVSSGGVIEESDRNTTAVWLHEFVDNQIVRLELTGAPLAWFSSCADRLINVNDETVGQNLSGWRDKLASLNQMDADKIVVSIF